MPVDDINTTFGSAFVSLVVSAVLYGLTLLQTYNYYHRFPDDSWRLKLLVAVLWLMDTLHLILCTTAIYWYLVLNYNNPDQLGIPHWSMNLQTDCNGLIGILVEMFFAKRVWMISKNIYLTGLIMVLACLHFGLGVYFTVEAFILNAFVKYAELTWVTSTGLGAAAAADILIAISLVYFLMKSRTGFEKTDSLITTLIVYAINTGLLTSICASLAVITFACMPLNFIWLSFFWCLGKLYVNSLLASLNSRHILRQKVLPSDGTFVQLSNLGTNSQLSPQANRRFSHLQGIPPRQPLTITVETTKEQHSDFYSASKDLSPSVSPLPLYHRTQFPSPTTPNTLLEVEPVYAQ